MDLPQDFLDRMEQLLGAEYGAFLAAYTEPRKFGLRVNTMKISLEEFQRLAPFRLRRIPWIENGFYYEKEDDPARHPFYSAGLYYLQEPSAMTPAQILGAEPGEWVLDLCAAPGGKATALGAALKGQGLLVANDVSASRGKALLKNLEVFGIPNAFVTNARPDQMAPQFPESFDKILVDAPCSGEGMFRKDKANARAWSLKKVGECAALQREILRGAVGMLRPGGRLLYSTCTFSPEEDEGTVAWLLAAFPEMELLEIPWYEGYSHGRPDLAAELWSAGALQGKEASPFGFSASGAVPEAFFRELSKCVRIYPHRMGGEGHFLALFGKRGREDGAWIGRRREAGEAFGAGCGKGRRTPGSRERLYVREPGSGCRPGGRRSDTRKSSGGAAAPGKPAAGERAALRDFFQEVALPDRFAEPEIRGNQVYFVPPAQRFSGTVPFLRNGLYAGELQGGRFVPSQSLAMALTREQYASVLDFPQDDPRVRQYLRGETVQADGLTPARDQGWQLVCVSGYPLGWGKLVGGTLKNKYHPGWRMR